MSAEVTASPRRFIGLDIHKFYAIACGVDPQRQPVLGPQRISMLQLGEWSRKQLTREDAVVLEVTTNGWQVYDDLLPYVHSVTLVHPPHLALITRAQVMTDSIAALTLARLHAAGLIPPVWVPPPAVRDARALVAQRAKMVRLATQAKNRLHAVLHRHHLEPPDGSLFAPDNRSWWGQLALSASAQARIQSDLDTLTFARTQLERFERALAEVAAGDERVPLLIQLPGIKLLSAVTILAAIGQIERFPGAAQLVGYAGLGARVHASGQVYHTGRLTKAGRRELRATLVEAAHTAANTHEHWQAQLARLEPRLGHNKAIVAIARKLLVSVWHVLSQHGADRFADPPQVARKLMRYSYDLGRAHRPEGQTAAQAVRAHLDRLGLGAELEQMRWGNKTVKLPPSQRTDAQRTSD